MNCTRCGVVWCPGEATVCSKCSGGTAAAVAGGSPGGSPGGPPPVPSSDDFVGRMIPSGNKPALIAYYVALLSLIPGLGIVFGAIAVIFGVKGVRLERQYPEVRGGLHAWFGILFGGFFALAWTVGLVWLAVAAGRH